jgi:CubicO group peptidase (beta-lactamase class C family)
MLAEGVPGISFAFFNREGVLWEHVSGIKNMQTRELVGPETVFEAASISKAVFSLLLQSLASDGVLDLTRPLVDYVDPVPSLGYDPRSRLLTSQMLLSHQGGLPNWRTRINLDASTYGELFGPQDTLRFVADPGEEYRYSGEGFVLLQRVIEVVTAETLGSLAESRVFQPLGMPRTRFSFDEVAEQDHAVGHARDGKPNKFGLRVTLASSTLHTTAADLARFGARLAEGVSQRGDLAALIEPRVTVEEHDEARLSWGLGLGVIDTRTGRYFFHGGNNVIFIADFIYGVEEDLGYVLLTNSANGTAMVTAVEERVFGRRLR